MANNKENVGKGSTLERTRQNSSLRFGLPGFIVLLFCLVSGCAGETQRVKSMERRLAEAVNEERSKTKLERLIRSEELDRIALRHARDMALNGALSHRSRNGLLVEERFERLGIEWSEAGENVARNRGFDDPVAEAVRGWLASPSHRENLLSTRFRETGVGVVKGKDGYYYFAQVFLRRMPPR